MMPQRCFPFKARIQTLARLSSEEWIQANIVLPCNLLPCTSREGVNPMPLAPHIVNIWVVCCVSVQHRSHCIMQRRRLHMAVSRFGMHAKGMTPVQPPQSKIYG